ncbi:hypothetical protein ACFE04_013623 [Oxalis oulophora]
MVMMRKRKYDDHIHKEEDKVELWGIPIPQTNPNPTPRKSPGVIFILENAPLQVVKIGNTYQLLNGDDHFNFLTRQKKNPALYRPDICYQALQSIWDSTIAQAGRLRSVYVKTKQGHLIEIKPYVKLPDTYKGFSQLMLQLLQKLSITGAGKCGKVLQLVKNPVTQHLPPNSRKIGFSHSSEKLVKMQNYVDTVSSDTNLVFVVGAMAHGKIKNDYTDDDIAVSNFKLSAAFCIKSICLALADKWDIL